MRVVQVKFLSTLDKDVAEEYFYKDSLSRKLQKYDTVLVPTMYGLSLAVVTKVDVDENNMQKRHGYGTLSPSSLKSVAEKIKSNTIEALNKAEKREDIKKELEKKLKEMDEVERYQLYAEKSPEIAALLKELKSL